MCSGGISISNIAMVICQQMKDFFSSLFLGDNESGKTTLMARLQGQEDPRKGSGLEYMYIDVKDEYRDGEFHY